MEKIGSRRKMNGKVKMEKMVSMAMMERMVKTEKMASMVMMERTVLPSLLLTKKVKKFGQLMEFHLCLK